MSQPERFYTSLAGKAATATRDGYARCRIEEKNIARCSSCNASHGEICQWRTS
jgi:hypothetical protein